MKKALLSVLLIPLFLLELVICTGFLPLELQHAINERISSIFPESPGDWSRVTHPRMDMEMDAVFQQKPWLRIASYALMAVLLVANTVLIRLVWQYLRTRKTISANHS